MDSFSVVFRHSCSDDEVRAAILATGANASCLEPGQIFASRETAHVWVDSYVPADLPSRKGWPIPKHAVGSILSIAVSRNQESSSLAIEIANRLAAVGGVISWDGNEYWRALYDKTYQVDSTS
jgi:hypothetical protein